MPNRTERIIPAQHAFARAGWGKRLKRYLYLYSIYPPDDRPFLPSDESLRTKVAHLPGIRFWRSERFADRDHFYVFGRRRSMFAKRGELALRSLRDEFLRDIAESATSERDIRLQVKEAANLFLGESGLANVTWTGDGLLAYGFDKSKYESWQMENDEPMQRLYRKLRRACKDELPFFYGTALF